MIWILAYIWVCLIITVVFLILQVRENRKMRRELDRMERILAPPGQPTHTGPANMDSPPSRVTKARYKRRARWER